jgi:hypothetical protein
MLECPSSLAALEIPNLSLSRVPMMANEVRCHFLADRSGRKLSDTIGDGHTIVPSACMFEQ